VHRRSRNHVQKNAEFHSNASIGTDKSPSPIALSLKEGQSFDEEEEDFSPQLCLFCNIESTSLDSNLTHMSHAHSFFIPNAEYLLDVESLLSYLFAIVSVFRECLFCGRLKNTKFGVRDHMRGKGHCKLNLDHDEHQLSQFYDFSGNGYEQDDEEELGEEVAPALNEGELLLPSGKIVGRRSRARSAHHNHPKRPSSELSSQRQQCSTETEFEIATTGPMISMESPDRTIAMRAGTSTSLIGLSEFQRRALMAVELKVEKMESRARNEYQSKVEKGGNKQKTYRVSSIGKKAGGLEKRLG
jgi:pre-60S factor REI1